MEFIFGTKAETLERIKPLITAANIPNQFYFRLKEWNLNREEIIRKIQTFLKSKKIVVRSSSLNEDTNNFSMAGNYKSILNVDINDKEQIIDSIEAVGESYYKDHDFNSDDQILIQPQISNIILSGVIFTRCHNTGAPYYLINYDDSSNRTDTITSGTSSISKTFTFSKFSKRLPSNPYFAGLLNVAREIEKITNTDKLDIEFAINEEGIYVLQIRPLASLKNIDLVLDENIELTLEKIKQFITTNNKRFPNLYGYKAIFGSMPDWNPAEIIGESPKPFAFSLYKELITDYIWPLSRKQVGYKDVGYHPGIVSLGGKPYVDVRLSFNTFLPKKITETTAEKLTNFYIDKLIRNTTMHDKIEFKIAYTCYKFGFEKEREELRKNNFSNLQIQEIKENLIDLTNKIVGEYFTTIDNELKLCGLLNEKREKIINSDINLDVKISQLIHDCKYYGTLPFCKLARFAFVGNILLTSLMDLGIITSEEKEKFIASINSVAKDFVNKTHMLKKGKISKDEFLKEFGHLRPGTYDLCSNTYKENFEKYLNLDSPQDLDFSIEEHFEFSDEKKARIEEEIKKEGLLFSAEQLLNFTRKALVAREKSKFEFTKTVSLILDYFQEYLEKYGFSKEDITFLSINDIISFSHQSKSIREIEDLRDKIEKNKENYKITKIIHLPELIYLEKTVDYFYNFDNNPNYITNKSIAGEIILLDENTSPLDINGKIVLINNADPGYDWIFTHNIKGLITKYGGVASHMSIRCAEFELPAAIGCGETIFNNLKKFKQVELNCSSGQIKGVL